MSLSRTLWDEITPPGVWITITQVETQEHDHVTLTLRIKEAGRRSVSASVPVTRYAPTSSIVLAVTKAIEAMAFAQCAITQVILREQLQAAVDTWVDPF
jgi:hypothetical protein